MKTKLTLFVCSIAFAFCQCTKDYDVFEGDFHSETYDTSTIDELPTVIQNLQENMAYIEGGTFTMGCTAEHGNECFSNENPTHNVTLSDYYIGTYEVTFAEWEAITGEYPASFDGCENCPVTRISQDDIKVFLDTLNKLTKDNYRLPTEAEWEYAARGGTNQTNTLYAGSDFIDDVAFYTDNSNEKTRPVGEKQPNELGLYDMSGNVWEWCSDFYGEYTGEAVTDPTGPPSGSNCVLRGGSFKDDHMIVRLPRRHSYPPFTRAAHFGFRLARNK